MKRINLKQKIMAILAMVGMMSMYIPAINNVVMAASEMNENEEEVTEAEIDNSETSPETDEDLENLNSSLQEQPATTNIIENRIENIVENKNDKNEISLDSDETKQVNEITQNNIESVQIEQTETQMVSAPSENNEDGDIITFKDENFKKFLLDRNVDQDKDGEISKAEMEALQNLYIYTNPMYGEITNIDEVKYAKNVTSIDINAYMNNILDISSLANLTGLKTLQLTGMKFTNLNAIKKLVNLENLVVRIDSNNSEMDLSNIENCTKLNSIDLSAPYISNLVTLNKLTKLQTARISSNSDEGSIDMKELSGNTSIQTLELIGKITNLDAVWNTKVSKLALYGDYSKSVDIKGIEKLKTLKNLTISGYDNMKGVNNLESVKNITQLDRLEFNIYPRYDNLQVMPYPEKNDEQRVVNVINSTNCNSVKVSGSLIVQLEAIEVGDKKVIKYEDLGPIMKSILTPGDKLYNSNLKMKERTDYETDTGKYITFDDDKKELTVNSSEFGELQQTIATSNASGISGYTGEFKIRWNSINTVAKKEEINIPDKNFEKALLENYDIDRDGVITTNDMANLQTMVLQNYNITDLTGIEYGTNINYVELGNNNISDVSPLANLPKLETISLENNNITDVTPLKDMKLYSIDLSYNKISDLNQFAKFKVATEPYYREDGSYFGRIFYIILTGNKVKDATPINRLTAIEGINLADNEIEDISSLANYDFDAIFEGVNESIKEEYSNLNHMYVNFDENYIDMSKPENARVEEIFKARYSGTFSALNQKSKYKLGDATGDEKINVLDCTAILNHIKGKKILTTEEQLRADVTKDGKINVLDCTAILNHIKGKKLIES